MKIKNFELRDTAAVRKYFELDQVAQDIESQQGISSKCSSEYQLAHKVMSWIASGWGEVRWFKTVELVELTSYAIHLASIRCEDNDLETLHNVARDVTKHLHAGHIYGVASNEIESIGGGNLLSGRDAVLGAVYSIVLDCGVTLPKELELAVRAGIYKYVMDSVTTRFGPIVSPITRGVEEGDVIEGVLRHDPDVPQQQVVDTSRLFYGLFTQYSDNRRVVIRDDTCEAYHRNVTFANRSAYETALAANYLHDGDPKLTGYDIIKNGIAFMRRLESEGSIIRFTRSRKVNKLDRMFEILELNREQTADKLTLVLAAHLREFTPVEIHRKLRGQYNALTSMVHHEYCSRVFTEYYPNIGNGGVLTECPDNRELRVAIFAEICSQSIGKAIETFYPTKTVNVE